MLRVVGSRLRSVGYSVSGNVNNFRSEVFACQSITNFMKYRDPEDCSGKRLQKSLAVMLPQKLI